MKVAVLFLIFNRPEVSSKAMKSIKEYQPSKLYIAADGPRISKTGEEERCVKTRQAVLEMIDWPCEVKTLFRDRNLGCAKAVSSAINWFFENEEFGVIVEDDIILGQDFYRFAKEMDDRYRDDERVMCINAQYVGPRDRFKTSYVFSAMSNPWGWATWRRAWKHMDMKMLKYPDISLHKYVTTLGLIRGVMFGCLYWRVAYRIISRGGEISSWWTRWAFNIIANDGLVIAPTHNMSVNVGFCGTDGTHYSSNDKDLYSFLNIETLPKHLFHPNSECLNNEMRDIESRDFIRIRKNGVKKKLRKIFPRFL